MDQLKLTIGLPFFGQIVEEEIYQNGVDMGFRVEFENFSPNQFDGIDAAATDKV